MRNKRGRLILMGLLSLLVVGGTIGGALAEEMRPYKAPELRLEQGADEYDLMEGITYRSAHYLSLIHIYPPLRSHLCQ